MSEMKRLLSCTRDPGTTNIILKRLGILPIFCVIFPVTSTIAFHRTLKFHLHGFVLKALPRVVQ